MGIDWGFCCPWDGFISASPPLQKLVIRLFLHIIHHVERDYPFLFARFEEKRHKNLVSRYVTPNIDIRRLSNVFMCDTWIFRSPNSIILSICTTADIEYCLIREEIITKKFIVFFFNYWSSLLFLHIHMFCWNSVDRVSCNLMENNDFNSKERPIWK